MAKAKSSKTNGSNAPHKHLHARLSFLHQAATFLAVAKRMDFSCVDNDGVSTPEVSPKRELNSQISSETTRLSAHLGGVSRKSQIRLAAKVKRSICKRCDSLLIPGMTSSEVITNSSRNGQKPWADVLEVRCSNCGTIKRFPVGMDNRKGRDKSWNTQQETEDVSRT